MSPPDFLKGEPQEPNRHHYPCVECVFGTYTAEPLPKGRQFRCQSCGAWLEVLSDPDDAVVHVAELVRE